MQKLDSLTREVRAELARRTDTSPDDWFLVFRARYGMEAALSVLPHGEVFTQPFTCATAVNPILSAGHVPLFIDANYDDLSLDTNKLQASTSSRAIIMQNSFSIESALKKARTFADKHHLLLIEDSAHHVGMMVRDDKQPLADISLHSFGVEKLLPTKFGGAVWVNPAMKDVELRDTLRSKLSSLPIVSGKTARQARRYRSLNRLLNHTPKRMEPSLRLFLTSAGFFQPAIMPDELTGKNHDTPSRPNRFVLEGMLSGLKHYKTIVEKRQIAADIYLDGLPATLTVPKRIPKDYAPARFPVLAASGQEAERLFDALRVGGHYSGKWYRPTLFPGVIDQKQYNYDPELCPVAEDIAARILNLPTNVSVKEAKEIVDVLHSEAN